MLVQFDGDDVEAARGAAMQVAALRARYLTRDEVPADVVDGERRVLEEKTRAEGKPEQAIAKIVEGRLNAFYADNVLLEQESVREPKTTVKQVLDERRRHGHQVRALRGRCQRRPDRVSHDQRTRREGPPR